MKQEEAKERLAEYEPFLVGEEWHETYKLAIEALDKQIPKKPRFVDDLVYEKYVCECGNVVAVETVEHIRGRGKNYCDRCGQAIDWSEEE